MSQMIIGYCGLRTLNWSSYINSQPPVIVPDLKIDWCNEMIAPYKINQLSPMGWSAERCIELFHYGISVMIEPFRLNSMGPSPSWQYINQHAVQFEICAKLQV